MGGTNSAQGFEYVRDGGRIFSPIFKHIPVGSGTSFGMMDSIYCPHRTSTPSTYLVDSVPFRVILVQSVNI